MTIVIFTEYARQFTRPLNDLANQFNTVLSAIAGADVYFQLWMNLIEEDAAFEHKDINLRGKVTFEMLRLNTIKTDEATYDSGCFFPCRSR